jgi:hypothetical protein
LDETGPPLFRTLRPPSAGRTGFITSFFQHEVYQVKSVG